jgi:tRNA G10  N-methylase Trm11
MAYVYRLAHMEHERDLAVLEGLALVPGATVDGRLLWASEAHDVRRAAFVSFGVKVLAEGATAEELVARARELHREAHAFRIDLERVPPGPVVDSQALIVALANALHGKPNLSQPEERYLILAREGRFIFGPVVSRSNHGWRPHETKPHYYSCSLLARVARAMVNLVARPGDAVCDPCCGVGSILLEAADLGLRCVGWDLNEKIVPGALANLRHYGYEALIGVGDARTVAGRFDVVVTDLPYGHSTPVDPGLARAILANTARLAPRLCIATLDPLEEDLAATGYDLQARVCCPAGSLQRLIYVAHVRSSAGSKP